MHADLIKRLREASADMMKGVGIASAAMLMSEAAEALEQYDQFVKDVERSVKEINLGIERWGEADRSVREILQRTTV